MSGKPDDERRAQRDEQPCGHEAQARAAYDAVVADLVERAAATSGSMFGMPCLKVGGKAFAGYLDGTMVFKLGAPEHDEALALPSARLFDPSGRGRPMKEWAQVPAAHGAQWPALAEAALRYTATGR